MNDHFKDILADNTEVLLDNLIENEILKEIPVIGNSLNIIRGIISIRDKAYLNKIKAFVNHLGEIKDVQKKKLIDESNKDARRRVKFGDALFTTIEQSDSLVKVEFLAIAFEAFLNGEISDSDLRLISHIIKNSFTDELIEIIENDDPKNLKYAVSSGLADMEYTRITFDMDDTEPRYHLSYSAKQLREAWKNYGKK